MRPGNGTRIIWIVILALVSGFILYQMPLQLGLDLQGGVHVVLQAQETEEAKVTEDTMQRAVSVIDRRVNSLGVAEPIIQRQGRDRVIVELPGITDQQTAIDVLRETAFLEIKDPLGATVLTGGDLADAYASQDQFGQPAVAVKFTREGRQKFANLTARWVGNPIPHVLDGQILVNPMVNEPITQGEGIITGNFTVEEAKLLAIQLKSGALPVPLEVLEVRNVGPTLGKEAIDSSLRAGVIGIILVFLFMLAYYRLPGGISDIALTLYVIFLVAIIAAIKATLTLPGIAGLILSIGMAVDANVLIFERLKEELAGGKRLRAAIEASFSRAFRAILDSNVTTLITAAVLFNFGTGPVRGFAVTLSIGILVSMFTAITVTKTLLVALVGTKPERVQRLFGVKEAAN